MVAGFSTEWKNVMEITSFPFWIFIHIIKILYSLKLACEPSSQEKIFSEKHHKIEIGQFGVLRD